MKKIIIFLLTAIILLNVTSCKNEFRKQLEKQYPDAEIRGFGGNYTIISENVDYSDVDNSIESSAGDTIVFYTYDELAESIYPDDTLIFMGKKTGESKQKIPVMDDNNVNGIFFTESKVEVITPYYGDISAGDEIVYHEYYAVFTDENGNKTLAHHEGSPPLNNSTYLFVVYTTEQSVSELYEGYSYSDIVGPYNPLKYDEYKYAYEPDEIAATLLEKYCINKDVAVDKTELAKQTVKRNSIINSNADRLNASDEDVKRAYVNSIELAKKENADYEELKQGLTDSQIEKIEKLVSKYGEK